MENNEYRGRVIVAYPKDGAGNLYAYVQFDGKSATGLATGYGYDKKSSAINDALNRMGFDAIPHFAGQGESATNKVFQETFKIKVLGVL
jgi:hypothetical protein